MKIRHAILVLSLAIGTTLPGRGAAAAGEELVTEVYLVHGFLEWANHPPSPGSSDESDLPAGTGGVPDSEEPRPTTKQLLAQAGFEFPGGANAIFNPVTSQLIVRNTAEVHSRLRAYLAALEARRAKLQIFLTAREMKFSGELLDHLTRQGDESPEEEVADAREGRAELKRIIFGLELAKEIASDLFTFPEPWPGQKPDELTTIFDEIESLLEQFTRPPLTAEDIKAARRLEKTKTLTDPEFQVLVRALAQAGNLHIESFPSVMVRIGQSALVQAGQSRIGIVPSLVEGPGNKIALDLYLPEVGEALDADTAARPRPSIRSQLDDGSTVVLAEKNANGENRIVFVTAQLLYPSDDPAPIVVPRGDRDIPVIFPEAGEAIQRADEFAKTARRLFEEEAFAEAESFFGTALHALPEGEVGNARREEYEKQRDRARVAKEQQRLETRVRFAREGETLEQIAAEAGVETGRLRETNRLGDRPPQPGQMLLLPSAEDAPSPTAELLRATVLPVVDFHQLPLADCLAAVMREMLRLAGPDSPEEAMPILVLSEPEKIGGAKVTLRLNHVPALEALRYLASLAGAELEVEGREVRISDS